VTVASQVVALLGCLGSSSSVGWSKATEEAAICSWALGITIVDLPGVGDINIAREKATNRLRAECHCFQVISDYEETSLEQVCPGASQA
jgi:hypothetical protein